MSGANASATRSASATARSLKGSRSHQGMTAAEPVVIFRDLPATFPEEDKYKKSSVIGSLVFHGVLIVLVLLVPLLFPQAIPERELLISLVAPIGPPPPAPPPPMELPAATSAPRVGKPEVRPVGPDVLIAPIAVPKEIVKLVEEPSAPPVGVVGGVPGGIPGGTLGGVLGGMLSLNGSVNALPALAPAPPPPPSPRPAPKEIAPTPPVRVGGEVKEPRPIKMIPPVYPPLASKARVSGLVVLEATITEQGAVEEIRVISGHPLLVEAAIACVKQWQYEPTRLNGIPVPIILTAKVRFERAPVS
jgi:protein TonB